MPFRDPVIRIRHQKPEKIDFDVVMDGTGVVESSTTDVKTQVKQLMDIADNDLIMPPKVTWFEPKLRSGLFVHSLAD